MSSLHSASPVVWAKRRPPWGVRRADGAGSDHIGLSGTARNGVLRAYLLIAVLTIAVVTVHIFTRLSDIVRYGDPAAPWEVITWETTSALSLLATCGIALLALGVAPPGEKPWWKLFGVHLVASLLFSLTHVVLMAAARAAFYAAIGLRYRMAASEWVYEYRKDALTYLALAAAFWVCTRRGASATFTPAPSPTITFDIIDGPRLVRVPIGEILAIHAAGNYVEFLLLDGRRPLMRAALREMEQQLVPKGFVRTHRSWIANAARVRGIASTGAGDFDISLEGDLTVPLSRRFRDGLMELRRAQ